MALWITEASPIELRPNATEDDLQTVIRTVYRQLLGNQHVLEAQRLTTAESFLRNGDITVRGFVRCVAQSDLYRSLFFEPSSPYRFIELNCKHLLGRAPADQAEIAAHVQRYHEQGYDVEINSYLDSDEYIANFGENIVPSPRTTQTQPGMKTVDFNRAFSVMRGFAANDIGNQAKLISDIGGNRPTKITLPATGSGAYSNLGKRFSITVAKAGGGPQTRRSNTFVEADYTQLSKAIQNIQKTGGKILKVTEVA